jgi:hypothetical protein
MSGNRLLRSNASVSPNEDAVITTIGPGKGDDELKRWFWDDNGAAGVEEVDITRDEKVAAGIAGYSGDKLRIYRVLYDPMTAPAQKLGPFENNPDVGGAVHRGGPAGRRQVRQPLVLARRPQPRLLGGRRHLGPRRAGHQRRLRRAADDQQLVIPGGKHPHWGPADIPPASAYEKKPVVVPTPQPQPGPQPTIVPPSPGPSRASP